MPRLHPGQWGSVDDAAKIVIRRWLTENSLEQFLRVVDRVAPTYQWTHRRAFWNAYFKKGYVLDAWVAFGRDGAKLARSVAADRQEDVGMAYGQLYRPPNSKQAVLLLRIGDLLVADWSRLGFGEDLVRRKRSSSTAVRSSLRHKQSAACLRF